MILVFCQKVTPRIEYTFKHVFEKALGIPVDFTTVLESFIAHNGPKMSYGEKPLGNEFFVASSGLLFDQGIQPIIITPKEWNGMMCFFEVDQASKLPFDLFSATFYLLTRYEEYLPHLKDEYGRFVATQSLVVKQKQLEKPLVDFWIKELYLLLHEVYPSLSISSGAKEKMVLLIDVVRPFKYLHNSIATNLLEWVKSIFRLNFWEAIEQLMVLCRFRKDPWDNFEEIKQRFSKTSFYIHFFFLYSKVAYYDRGISRMNTNFQSLIKEVADYFDVSLFVSFSSRKNGKKLREECYNLNQLIHREIKNIRFSWGVAPVAQAYKNLITQEVENDFSLAYPDAIGYRASTAIPFLFYDLINELVTDLTIYPVVAVEASLRRLPPLEAIQKLHILAQNIPLASGIHCFALSNKTFEKSISNDAFRSAFISYLETYDSKRKSH